MHCPVPSVLLNIYILVLGISNISVLMRQNSMVNINYHSSTRLYKEAIDFQILLEKPELIEIPCLSFHILIFPLRSGIGLWKNWICFLPGYWLLRRGHAFNIFSKKLTFWKSLKNSLTQRRRNMPVKAWLTNLYRRYIAKIFWASNPILQFYDSMILSLSKSLFLYFVHGCSS